MKSSGGSSRSRGDSSGSTEPTGSNSQPRAKGGPSNRAQHGSSSLSSSSSSSSKGTPGPSNRPPSSSSSGNKANNSRSGNTPRQPPSGKSSLPSPCVSPRKPQSSSAGSSPRTSLTDTGASPPRESRRLLDGAGGFPGAVPDELPVKVVAHVRPMVKREELEGCQNCLSVSGAAEEALPEVSVVGYNLRSFAFDHVYGDREGAAPSAALFPECVEPLVEGLFGGFNGTVLAYGQTGAGKTYTIGTHCHRQQERTADGDHGRTWQPVIPLVSELLFRKAEELRAQDERTSVEVTLSFLEVYQNSIRDLLVPKGSSAKESHIEIRERGVSGIDSVVLEGQTEEPAASGADLDSVLHRGVASRTTHATNMNEHSSRSHAIFTINLAVKRWRSVDAGQSDGPAEEFEESLTAKMHIVDLAGSERIKKSGVEGQQQKEAASINLGLLSLRNCIEALCKHHRGFVPYRSNKLTRLLQDSLGGNARTVMIACVSPADSSMEETLNTLKYASSARNIKNKVVANRDEESGTMVAMMEEIRVLREQLAAVRMTSEDGAVDIALLRSGAAGAAQGLQLKALQEDRDRWRMRASVAEADSAARAGALRRRGGAAEDADSDAGHSTPPHPHHHHHHHLLRRATVAGGPMEPGLNPLFADDEEGAGGHEPLSTGVHSAASPLGSAPPSPLPLPKVSSRDAGLSALGARQISVNSLFEFEAEHADDAASTGSSSEDASPWLAQLHQAKSEHGQHVVARKQEDADRRRAILEGLEGSVLGKKNDGKLRPPTSQAALPEWLQMALRLDTQASDLKVILDAKMASRAACAQEICAVMRHTQLLEAEADGSVLDGEDGGELVPMETRQRLEQLKAQTEELQESLREHNRDIVKLQALRLSLEDASSNEESQSQALKRRFKWVAPEDYMCVIAAVYKHAKMQREQLMEIRTDNMTLREELVWRDRRMDLYAAELDKVRAKEPQLRDELYRAAAEKVRVLSSLSLLEEDKSILEDRLVDAEAALQALHQAHQESQSLLEAERSKAARARSSLDQKRKGAAPSAPAAPRQLEPSGSFATPESHSLVHDDVLEAMHRAAEEKTEISYNLAEKEELLFYLTQKIPQVEALRKQWEASREKQRKNQQELHKNVDMARSTPQWWWPSSWKENLAASFTSSHKPRKCSLSSSSSATPPSPGGESVAPVPSTKKNLSSHLDETWFGRSSPPKAAESESSVTVPPGQLPPEDDLPISTLGTAASSAGDLDSAPREPAGPPASDATPLAASAQQHQPPQSGPSGAPQQATREALFTAVTNPLATGEEPEGAAADPLLGVRPPLPPSSKSTSPKTTTASSPEAAAQPGRIGVGRGGEKTQTTQNTPDTDPPMLRAGTSSAADEPGIAEDEGGSSINQRKELFERLAQKKAQRSILPKDAMKSRIDMREAHGSLNNAPAVEKPPPASFHSFDDRLPPQGVQGYVSTSVNVLETFVQVVGRTGSFDASDRSIISKSAISADTSLEITDPLAVADIDAREEAEPVDVDDDAGEVELGGNLGGSEHDGVTSMQPSLISLAEKP